jgi:hypothetical protein
MIAGMANFESTVRATNALTATNEYYSAELARVVRLYAEQEKQLMLAMEQLRQTQRLEAAGAELAHQVGRMCTTECQRVVLASSCKSKSPVPFDAVSCWDLSAVLAKYTASVKPPTDG